MQQLALMADWGRGVTMVGEYTYNIGLLQQNLKCDLHHYEQWHRKKERKQVKSNTQESVVHVLLSLRFALLSHTAEA